MRSIDDKWQIIGIIKDSGGGGGFHHIPTDPRPQNPMESHQTTNGEAEGRREEEERRGRGEGKEVAN